MRRIRVIIYRWLRKIIRLNDSPESIATGASIGFFVGMLPVYGFQMMIAFAVAAVARINKVAAIIPAWVTNPLTIPPILFIQYHVGKLLVGGEDVAGVPEKIGRLARAAGAVSPFDLKNTSRQVFVAARELGWEILWPTLIGSIVTGTLLGLAAYPLTLRGVLWYRRRRDARRALRRERLAAYLEEKARVEAVTEGQPEPETVPPPGP
ncbi:MAG: DUF2062 domain-containing protein [Planctomycetota bacterium]|jgi:uncharacterized protein (DUF2062 family)